MELTTRASTVYPFSAIEGLNDPSTYYGGYKDPRVRSFSPVVRGLSDSTGATQHVTFGARLTDGDRMLRGLTGSSSTQALTNAPLVLRTVTDADRRALQPMHFEMVGFVGVYSPISPLLFDIQGTDWLKQRLMRRVSAPEYWVPLLTRSAFPQLPADLLNKACPIVLGKVTNAVETGPTDPNLYPRNTIDPVWLCDLGRNGWGSGSFSAGTVYFFVSTITDGVESTIIPNSTSFVFSGPSPGVQLKFRSANVPTLYRVYFSDSGDFHPFNNPTAGSYARYVDIDPATIPEGNCPYGSPSPEDLVKRFVAITSPTQGQDYHNIVGGGVNAATGACPTLHVGELLIGGVLKSAFLVSYGAIKNITSIHVGGVQVTSVGSATELECPFLGDYAAVHGANYMDLGGARYTIVLASGQTAIDAISGTKPITVNAWGVESKGDTTGTLLTSPVRLHQWFVRNFLAADPFTTPPLLWLTVAPNMPSISSLCMQDDDSYDAVEADLQARITGGYEAAGIINVGGDVESANDILAALRLTGDFNGGFNRFGQEFVSSEPKSAPVSATVLTDVWDILSFDVSVEFTKDFWNVIPFVHTKDYTGTTQSGWQYKGSMRDAASIGEYAQERTSQELQLRFLRASTTQGTNTIKDVIKRIRLRWRNPTRKAVMKVPYSTSADVELGDVLRIDHLAGLTVNGWTSRDLRTTQITTDLDLDKQVRTFELYDLQPIYDGLEDVVEPTWAAESPNTNPQYTATGNQQQVINVTTELALLRSEVAALTALVAAMTIHPAYALGGSSGIAVQSGTPTWVPADMGASRVWIDPADRRASTAAVVYVRLRALTAGVTVQARLYNHTLSAVAGTGTLKTSTTWVSDQFNVTLGAGACEYELQVLPGTANEDVQCVGYLQ